MKSVDRLQLEVCVREGTTLKIHPDQVKQWKSSGAEFEQNFEELRNRHAETYANSLSGLITQALTPAVSGPGAAAAAASPTEAAVIPIEDEHEEPEPPQTQPQVQLTTFESLEKLQESETVDAKCVSEVAGIELLRTSSGKIFLLSDKEKAIPRHTILGGFGTGKYLGLRWINEG